MYVLYKMDFLKLNEYCEINDVKFVEIKLIKKVAHPCPPYKLMPTFGIPRPNKDGKMSSENIFTDDF